MQSKHQQETESDHRVRKAKIIRMSRGMSLAELSAATALPRSTIGNYENNKKGASWEVQNAIATCLGVTVDELNEPVEDVSNPRRYGVQRRLDRPVKAVPIVASSQAGPGINYDDIANQIDTWVETQLQDHHAFAVIVEGTSMEPEIMEGDIAIVDTSTEPRNGDIVCARRAEDGSAFIKRFKQSGARGEKVRLISTNPDVEEIRGERSEFRFIYPCYEIRRKVRY